MTENNKLIIELTNLGEGSMRTIKRELKVLIEDYGYKKMISGCINVKEALNKMPEEKEGLIDGQYIDGLKASGAVGAVGIGYGLILKIPLSDIDSAKGILKEMWK